jgi:hypothetical protein
MTASCEIEIVSVCEEGRVRVRVRVGAERSATERAGEGEKEEERAETSGAKGERDGAEARRGYGGGSVAEVRACSGPCAGDLHGA